MKRIIVVVIIAVAFCAGFALAQGQPFIIVAQPFTHTACQTAVGETRMCVVTDGVWVSENGAAYAKLSTAGGTAGVVSFNGQTGVVNYVPPVTSVNGKTGNVALTIN